MSEDKKTHLQFIQDIVTRMNTNSFQLKGLCITLISALLGIYVTTLDKTFILIGLFPSIVFFCLDAYYLQMERKFRGVYDDVSGLKSHVKVKKFEMPIHKYKGGSFSFINVLFSKTIFWVYAPMIIFLVMMFALLP